jgi:hypothetical protein
MSCSTRLRRVNAHNRFRNLTIFPITDAHLRETQDRLNTLHQLFPALLDLGQLPTARRG